MDSEASGTGRVKDRRLLESVLDRDGDTWGELYSTYEGSHALSLLTIATSVAVFKKWPDHDPSLAEISTYVVDIFARMSGQSPVGPTLVEALIRSSLGETGLIKGFPSADIVYGGLILIQAIQSDAIISPEDRNAYLNETLDALSSK